MKFSGAQVEALKRLWQHAVDLYRQGRRGSGNYFNAAQVAELAALGIRPQEIYDFAEDYVGEGVPTFESFRAIQEVRYAYFQKVQQGQPSGQRLETASLPGKHEAFAGFRWLPRLVPKALAKLRGELSDDIMFNCGGDRAFFDAHGLQAAAFLERVWETNGDLTALGAYVKARGRS